MSLLGLVTNHHHHTQQHHRCRLPPMPCCRCAAECSRCTLLYNTSNAYIFLSLTLSHRLCVCWITISIQQVDCHCRVEGKEYKAGEKSRQVVHVRERAKLCVLCALFQMFAYSITKRFFNCSVQAQFPKKKLKTKHQQVARVAHSLTGWKLTGDDDDEAGF